MEMKLDAPRKRTIVKLSHHEHGNAGLMRILKNHGAEYVRETKANVYYESEENLFVTLRAALCGGKA